MAQERKDIITDEALAAPLVMAENLEVEYEWLLKVSKAGQDASKAVDQSATMQKNSNSIKELTKEQEKLVHVQNDLASAAQKTVKATSAEATALLANRQAYAQLRTEQQRNTKEGKELLKTIQDQEKKLKDAGKETVIYSGSVAQLRKELKAAKDNMVAIASSLGEDSEEFKEAALRAGELTDKLGDIATAAKIASSDTSFQKMGAQFSDIGDKLKGMDFKGAALQVRNLSTTIKGMSFKESIDGVGGLGKAFGALGKAILTNPLFLIVAAVVGIALAINALKDKLFPLVKLFDLIGEGLEWVTQKAKDFSDSLGLSAFAAEDSMKRTIAAVDAVQKKLSQKYDDEIKLAEAAGKSTMNAEKNKQRMLEQTADVAVKAIEKNIAAGNKLEDEEKKRLDEMRKIRHDAHVDLQVLRLQELQQLKEIQAGAKKEVERQIEERNKLEQQRIAQAIKVQEDIAKTEGKSYEERIAASVKAEQKRIQLINAERKAALGKTSEGDIFQQAAINEKAQAQILEVRKASAAAQRQLLVESIEDEIKLAEEMAASEKATYEQRVDGLTDAMEKRIDILDIALKAEQITQKEHDKAVIDQWQATTDRIVQLTLERQEKIAKALQDKAATGTNNELTVLEDQLTKQEITYKEYTERRKEIQDAAEAEAIASTLDALKEQAEIMKRAGMDTVAVQREISEIELSIAADKNKLRIEGEQAVQDKLKEIQTAGVEGLLSIIDNFNAAADERRQMESEKIAANLENDLALVGNNELAKSELRNKAAIEQEKLRKEQAAADRKRALFEKATAAISIGINTAKGIGMALGTYPPPVSFVLAALVGVLGAIQLGVVLSKPIPSYAKGTKGHKGGWARVGEQGQELIIEPSGEKYLSPGKESFLNLPANTKVIPHEETINALARGAVGRLDNTRGTAQDASTRKLERKLDQLNYTIRNKKELHINYTRAGAEAMFRSAESKIKFLNDFYY